MKPTKKIITKQNINISLCLSAMLCFSIPSKAFIPNTYIPNSKELNYDALEIGTTASKLIQFGEAKEAIHFLNLALQLNPNAANLWLILAEAQIQTKELNAAAKSIDKAITINPKESKNWMAKGLILMRLNNPEKAIVYLRRSLLLNKKNANGYFNLGNAYLMLQEFKLALQAFKEASNIQPTFWQAINNEAIALYELDKKTAAISKWRQVLKITNDSEPMLALAVALYETNQAINKTLNLAKTALINNPNYVMAEYQEKQLWGQKLRSAAEKFFKREEMTKSINKAKANAQ